MVGWAEQREAHQFIPGVGLTMFDPPHGGRECADRHPMIVTIDGPAGAGKSSAARALARRLGFAFLDTGAMYRAVTLAALRRRCDTSDQAVLANLITELRIDMPPGRVLLNGEDVTGLIRTPAITAASGAIASSRSVREKLVGWQREIAARGDFVCEGRDQGTIVFPDALCKFFLFADPVERARRRQADLATRGDILSLDDVLKAQQERDARDAARDIAPMVPAADAIQLDTTALTLEQVVDRMEAEVRRRIAAQHPLPPVENSPSAARRAPLTAHRAPLTTTHSALDRWMNSDWFRLWHGTCYFAYFWALTLGWSLRMQGERNMPKRGPVLLIANHQSFLDPILCGLVARRPMVYLARKTLFTNRFGAAIIRSLNAVPIDQEGVGKEGIRTILDQLAAGKAVVVYPEGERTFTGRMQALKPGIHLLIKRAQVPIVPVGIAGAFDAMPRWAWMPTPAPLCWPAQKGTIAISMGQPLEPHHYADLPRDKALLELFDRIDVQQKRAERLRRR